MISKRSPPPRPPMPSRKSADPSLAKSVVHQEQQDPVKKLDFFSIRYSRDDTNESDEEISIVRKEDSVEDEEEILDEKVSSRGTTSEENIDHPCTSLLSSISLPFLSRSTSKSSIESTDEKARLQNNAEPLNGKDSKGAEKEEAEVEDASSMTNGACHSGEVSNGRYSGSPPKRKNEIIKNAMVSSAMSLSSLLKKEVEPYFARGNTNGTHKQEHTVKGILSKAVENTSLLLMPLGISSEVTYVNSSSKTESIHTDVPLYNILIVSSVAFLYLMLPTSSFINGFVFGGFLTFFFVCALMWLLTPEMNDEERYKRDLLDHNIEMDSLERKEPRKSQEPHQLSKPQDLEGWFFKASSYKYSHSEPVDFSDSEQVFPVYVSLSGHTMTFNIPRKDELSKIKRSSMLERNTKIKFGSSKEYDLRNGGEIELVPDTMTLKRIWAKKYPIYLNIFEKPSPNDEDHIGGNEHSFEFPTVTEEMYLFSPTGRGKEEWYYRMEKLLRPRTHQQLGVCEFESIFDTRTSFPHYMAQLIGAESEPSSQAQLTWVNALLGRLFWDVWKSEHWSSKVKSRIQNKISKMKLPPFIRYLKVTDMRLGNALPTIQRAHNLLQDNRGIWVDLDVDYQGGIMLTIETMINLEYYLKQLTDQGKTEPGEVVLRFNRYESGDSDVGSGESDTEEDWNESSVSARHLLSPESLSGSGSGSSSDTEVDVDRQSTSSLSSSEPTSEQDNQGWAGNVKNPKGKKILNMLEKVAKSKWVQKAAETKVVQRAVEKFSNLPIVLGVEVVRLRGTLAANIPPPPSNRLWLGFHSNPLLSLIARPQLGERHVRLTHVTEWIEYKLKQEFKSMFVLPNMEDLTIRIMDSGLEEKFAAS